MVDPASDHMLVSMIAKLKLEGIDEKWILTSEEYHSGRKTYLRFMLEKQRVTIIALSSPAA